MNSPNVPIVEPNGAIAPPAPPVDSPDVPVASPDQASPETSSSDQRAAATLSADMISSLQSLMGTVVIAIFVITFIVQAFQIPSESMENTLLIGDYLLVNKLCYGGGALGNHLMPYQKITRGDIIVFGYADDRGELGAFHRLANFFGLRAVIRQRVIEIALHEAAADRPGGSSKPDLPRISGNESLGKRDQLRALCGGLIDQRDGLVHRCIEIEKNRRRLNHRNPVFLMNETHRLSSFRIGRPTIIGPEAYSHSGPRRLSVAE